MFVSHRKVGVETRFREQEISLLCFVSSAYKMATMPTENKFVQIMGYVSVGM